MIRMPAPGSVFSTFSLVLPPMLYGLTLTAPSNSISHWTNYEHTPPLQ